MINNIIKMSIPILISSSINMATMIINFRNVGNLQKENFYFLALYLSINYLVMACAESFRATVISTMSFLRNKGDITKFLHSILLLSSMSFIVFDLLFLIFKIISTNICTLPGSIT